VGNSQFNADLGKFPICNDHPWQRPNAQTACAVGLWPPGPHPAMDAGRGTNRPPQRSQLDESHKNSELLHSCMPNLKIAK